MTAPTSTETAVLRHPVAKGWFVHSFTALGALCGMFGLMAVSDQNYKIAILWLAIAMVVDGLDGLAARKYEVKTHVPRIDGYTLDLIIDFVTCIVIPVLFMWLATVLLMTADLPDRNPIGKVLLVACPLYIVGLVLWRTLTGPPGGGDELVMPSTMHA